MGNVLRAGIDSASYVVMSKTGIRREVSIWRYGYAIIVGVTRRTHTHTFSLILSQLSHGFELTRHGDH